MCNTMHLIRTWTLKKVIHIHDLQLKNFNKILLNHSVSKNQAVSGLYCDTGLTPYFVFEEMTKNSFLPKLRGVGSCGLADTVREYPAQ